MYELDPRYKQMILDAMNYHFPNARIILFGSRARGNNKESSDIDIAIDTGQRIRLSAVGRARTTLEHLPLPVGIDLVDFRSIPQELRDEINRDGNVWKN